MNDHWEKIAKLPFAQEVVADLMGEFQRPVEKDSQHGTLINVGRRELAIDLLRAMGELK